MLIPPVMASAQNPKCGKTNTAPGNTQKEFFKPKENNIDDWPELQFSHEFKNADTLEVGKEINFTVEVKNKKNNIAYANNFTLDYDNTKKINIFFNGKNYPSNDTIFKARIDNKSKKFIFTVKAGNDLKPGMVQLVFNGRSEDDLVIQNPDTIKIFTKEYEKPEFEIVKIQVDQGIESESSIITRAGNYKISIFIKNTGKGKAENVKTQVIIRDDYYISKPSESDGKFSETFPNINPGDTKKIEINLKIVKFNIEKRTSPIQLPVYLDVIPDLGWGMIQCKQLPIYIDKN